MTNVLSLKGWPVLSQIWRESSAGLSSSDHARSVRRNYRALVRIFQLLRLIFFFQAITLYDVVAHNQFRNTYLSSLLSSSRHRPGIFWVPERKIDRDVFRESPKSAKSFLLHDPILHLLNHVRMRIYHRSSVVSYRLRV